jgi:drug/metabolite transporter (DMT)-like permease
MSTRRFYVLGFGALMLCDTATQVFLKLAATQAGEIQMTAGYLQQVLVNPWVYGAVCGYLGSFFTWMTLLEHAPVGPAFAASHLEVVTVLIISVLFFGEHLAPLQIVGCVSIVSGIIFLSMSASKHPHA